MEIHHKSLSNFLFEVELSKNFQPLYSLRYLLMVCIKGGTKSSKVIKCAYTVEARRLY